MPEAEAPVVWGDFEVRLDRLLGRGGMGSVYEARQISLDRKVAVKVLDTDRAPTEELAEGFLGKFQHEARALAKLNDPRIVTILQAGRADGKCWYAMELVEGDTVDQRISDAGALEAREAARVAAEVARALAAALAQGIIHRDVKPANIFLTPDGRVKLGDFGLARSGGFKPTRFTEMNAVAGTPEYASPEQAANGACDHRSDQYSLGAVLFEMVTERPPFGGANAIETFFKHAHEPPPRPSRLNPGIPPALEAAILRCLEKDPGRRYPNYDELIRDLEAVRAASADATPEPARAPERPTLAIRTALVAGAVLLGFSIWGASRIFSKGPETAPKMESAPVAKVKKSPPPPAPPVPPPPAPIEETPPPPPKMDEAGALKAAWDACDRGDGVALSSYLEKKPDAELAEELAGIREPFAHPTTKAFERAILELYAKRGHEPAALGEIKAWKAYSKKGTWEKTDAGIRISDRQETWLSRALPAGRGFSLTLRFTPDGSASWAGVALTQM
jgi:serine/threonine protein kinase